MHFLSLLEKSTPENIVNNLLNPPLPLTRSLAIKHAMVAAEASAESLDRAKDYITFHKIKTLTINQGHEKIQLMKAHLPNNWERRADYSINTIEEI